ncbi:UvrD-helicase domain-containing protein [Brevibacillus sp. FSL K6-0770]|uniref:UvrD-helicase domain-containing protein n=1 Tax=unclassified Brevibacillus TaxID=2684853 RepID=UPI00156B70F6|nr:UvrD-helicase domain-containing protein [Brevibacillus sp. HD1.4A]NRQ54605.1 ATP-dependent helicase [Brevibacillus sp. HD1.4A]
MIEVGNKNPAEEAAERAIAEIYRCLDQNKSFLLEAGAGAGKTYSLIQALKYIVNKQGNVLLQRSQQIACITYTNVACDEIKNRVDGHPAVLASTIHAFCWSLIKDFQSQLWHELCNLPKWIERFENDSVRNPRKIEYDFGYPQVESEKISLGHNDVILLTALLMKNNKFRNILSSRYPILFIDEYQDTNKDFTEAILNHFVDNKESRCLIGFYGDGWQKIYSDGCGAIKNENLHYIYKQANFRSEKAIVNVLNLVRPDLKQAVKDPQSNGAVRVFHTNEWSGERLTKRPWKGDLPADIAHEKLEMTRDILMKEGWGFEPEKTKILMLTNNLLANEQGYSGIAKVFQGRNDDYVRQEDPHIDFFVNTLEPLCSAFESKQYGTMFEVLDRRTPNITSLSDKTKWVNDMETLIQLRLNGTIGEVLAYITNVKRPRLSGKVEEREQKYNEYKLNSSNEQNESMERLGMLRSIPYREVIALTHYIKEKTPFSTKHGVKGAEFENVLVVIGRGWDLYNFNQFLELSKAPETIPNNKVDFYERNRNLFYVAISRPMKRLAILFTQELSEDALSVLTNWMEQKNIHAI